MPAENINQRFRLKKKTDEIRKDLIGEINEKKIMIRKHKKICRVLNYTDHWLITANSTITECVSISDFASVVGIPTGITSSLIG